jgi:hypothetical protein
MKVLARVHYYERRSVHVTFFLPCGRVTARATVANEAAVSVAGASTMLARVKSKAYDFTADRIYTGGLSLCECGLASVLAVD